MAAGKPTARQREGSKPGVVTDVVTATHEGVKRSLSIVYRSVPLGRSLEAVLEAGAGLANFWATSAIGERLAVAVRLEGFEVLP